MNKSTFIVLLAALLSGSVATAQPRTGTGRAEFFDSTAYSDAFRISMTGVSAPSSGKVFVAWLGGDDDVQYLKLGQLTVPGSGNVSFVYKDNSNNNLLASNKKFLITEEISPFSGSAPTLASVVFVDSLHGPGLPSSTSPLSRIRNCLVTFTNTAQNLGLAIWLKKHILGYTEHAGLARNEALADQPGGAKVHADHVYDFIRGKLSALIGNSSVAVNGDPIGYGYRRYGDNGTRDSTLGGAGSLGGAGYHVGLVISDPTATDQMKKAGGSALLALKNAFGAANDSGSAKAVTDRALNIINGVYQSGSLPGEGLPFYDLAMRFINGTVGGADTAAYTGGILQAYHHMQQMATFVLAAPLQPVSVDRIDLELPAQIEMMQNYPNPFNGMTIITFRLPSAARVRMTIYNLLGQEMARLIDKSSFEAGIHSAIWESGSAGSGIYVCELVIGTPDGMESRTEARRMILLK